MLSESVSCSVVSYSLQPRGLQPTRPLCPWNSPSKNTGVACSSLLHGCLYNRLQLCVETSGETPGDGRDPRCKVPNQLKLDFCPRQSNPAYKQDLGDNKRKKDWGKLWIGQQLSSLCLSLWKHVQSMGLKVFDTTEQLTHTHTHTHTHNMLCLEIVRTGCEWSLEGEGKVCSQGRWKRTWCAHGSHWRSLSQVEDSQDQSYVLERSPWLSCRGWLGGELY